METQNNGTREGDREVLLLRYRVFYSRDGAKPELFAAQALLEDARRQADARAANPEHRGATITVHDAYTWNSPVVYKVDGGSKLPSATVIPLHPKK